MKRLIPLIVLLFAVTCSRAQTDSTFLYLRFPTVPPFTITKVADSTRFTKADLSRKKATIIIIFSPDCEHCQHETRELTANIKLFKKAQIIMASPLEHPILKKFYDEYGLAAYPNIIMGRDPPISWAPFTTSGHFRLFLFTTKKGICKGV